jgi:tetratricopeptide (TPR) repeat protein
MKNTIMRGKGAFPASAAVLCALIVSSLPGICPAATPAPGTPAGHEPPVLSRPAPADTGRASAPSEPQRPGPKIKVTRATPDAGPSLALLSAYNALKARDYDTAGRLYEELARTDPRNLDVLLGQAAVALHRGDIDAARNRYMGVLRLEPANATAQGALLALFGGADYAMAELRLKELAAREPSAFLYQALGNLYAEQALWPQAQHAYFQAHRLDARNADHAYNLAVSLEHIGQRALAGTYYRRAVELVPAYAAPGFDVAQAASRAAQLSAAASTD